MKDINIAYFSAEIGIRSDIKTYSGGLGILAGDTLKAAADLEMPICGITLLYKHGFLKQKIVEDTQQEEDDDWDFMNILEYTGKESTVNISGEDVFIKIWKLEIEGISGHKIPIFFLDTDIDKNPSWAQPITNKLYQGDRLAQEMVLGIGGIRALKELGIYNKIKKFHMNEGHSCLLTLQLYKDLGEKFGWDDENVRKVCSFTTHTPIPAGHDKFDYSHLYEKFKGEQELLPWHLKKLAGEKRFNTTNLAINLSSYVNAVSKKHKEVTKEMFPFHTIDHITNGIHGNSWTNDKIKKLYDKYIPDWQKDNTKLIEANNIPNEELWNAHSKCKEELIKFVNSNNVNKIKLDKNRLTIGFARRFIEYKDAELIFENLDTLKEIGEKVQFIFAGKSHSNDGIGKNIMRRIIKYSKELQSDIKIAFIEDYNIEVTKKMVSGCNLWLNTPIPPNEASGTSGMKASINGCLHFSRLDGWAIEAYERNAGGFPIIEYKDLITNLKYKIIPMYYSEDKTAWVEEMKLSIVNGGSFFNTHRMVREYYDKSYMLKN